VVCPACQRANPEDAAFCGGCGAPLRDATNCPACGRDNPPGQAFCNGCGQRLEPTPVGRTPPERSPRDYTPRHLAEKILRSRSALEGERKLVTVLFADVKDSTALAERLDAEEWHRVLDRFFGILTEGVHRFEGTVNQYTGDGIMALFGAPIAHEDHAQRACYAALRLRDELGRFAEELRTSHGLEFGARIGIHSGEVVVGKIGDDLRMDYTAQGHTVGLAARMEPLAPPGGVCLSEATARLVEGYVRLRDLGSERVKGASGPVRVFALEGPGEIRTRFEQARARGLTRFVGREADLAVLEQALEQARAGNGQVVGVVAEAGAGKSRLCFEFVERCRARWLTVLQGGAVSHGKNVPLLPILQLFRQCFGIGEQDGDREAREKIEQRLSSLDGDVRLVTFDFLGIPDPDRPPPRLEPEARQRMLFDVMRAFVDGDEGVTIVFIEDLHWIDASSDNWLEQIVEAVAGARTLVLVNFRPEYHAAWMQKSWYRQLPLAPLGPETLRELLRDLLGPDPSLAGLAEAVHARTAGNPFFGEEIVQNLIESGNLVGSRGAYRLVTPLEALDVPDTVHSVLAARIDRLGEREKLALQAASLIGREFAEPILSAVLDWPERELASALRALKDAEFVHERSLYPVTEYAFKHPLTQEVALGSQLRERRARTHAAVARALEAAHPDRLDEQAALLAHHWEAAGDVLQAARWHCRAGTWLLPSDAPAGMTHWKRVHELAASESDTREALEMRLEACGKLVIGSYQLGIPRDERDRLAAEGREIAERLGDRLALFSVDLYLVISQLLAGWSSQAPLIPTQRAVALADELDLGLEMRVLTRVNRANIAWTAGRVAEALRAAEEALDLAAGNLELGMHIAGFSIANLALYVKWGLLSWSGRPREAAACLERCQEVAHRRGEMLECQMLSEAAQVQELTGIPQQALARCREAVELGERQGDLFNRTITTLHLGWAQLMHGDINGAVESLLVGDHLQRARGVASNHLNLGQGLLAEAYLAAGDPTNARLVADRCTAQLDAWVWELRAHLSRARVLRTLDGAGARAQVEASLARAGLLLEWSGARAFAPFIVEELARLAAILGEDERAAELLRRARALYGEVEATGHVERLTRELGA
jgi:class 3 adenylate cyclase/tetratricopeptide (TPR) repeat protein